MRVPTVKIRNTKTGQTLKVNVSDWASDLGVSRYRGWSLVGGESDDSGGLTPEEAPKKTVHEVKPVRRRGRPRKKEAKE